MKTKQSGNEEKNRAAQIAGLNDAVRSHLLGYVMTSGVAEMTTLLGDILEAVRSYKEFTADNDPYDEHDFGSFDVLGIRFFWKIDYYDQNLRYWCDPLDRRCRRQLTIMLAEEY